MDNGKPGSIELESTTDRRYYTTDAFTDYGIEFVEEALDADDEPFFLYLPFNAPHWPLHAHEEVVAKYRDAYTDGWDALRERRYQRQLDLGLFEPENAPLSESVGPQWETLSEAKREEMTERMAIYAAQIDIVDRNVGRLVDVLEDRGELDNTLFMFLSDNGACAEFDMLGSGPADALNRASSPLVLSYGEAWAHASNTPFRKYKRWVHEGGAATPLIVHSPDGLDDPNGDFRREPAYLPDVMATLVDVADAEYPETRDDVDVPPMEGTSLRPLFEGNSLDRGEPMFMEHEGNRFVRDGRWKLVSEGPKEDYGGPDSWELFDMATDRTESKDLSDERLELVDRLRGAWWDWAERVGVVPNGLGIESRDDFDDRHGTGR